MKRDGLSRRQANKGDLLKGGGLFHSKDSKSCKIYGHTAGKIRAGNSLFCNVCGKRFKRAS